MFPFFNLNIVMSVVMCKCRKAKVLFSKILLYVVIYRQEIGRFYTREESWETYVFETQKKPHRMLKQGYL